MARHPLDDMRTVSRLLQFIQDVQPRHDWHEPDEQDITAAILGTKLDNAMGDDPRMFDGSVLPVEQIVVLRGRLRGSGGMQTEVCLNLASLLALATVGAQTVRKGA